MGLDITAYSHMAPVPDHKVPIGDDGVPQKWCPNNDDEGLEQHELAFAYAGFEQSLDGLEPGRCYRETEGTRTHRFRAGSYSGYGRWRDDLAKTMLGAEDGVVYGDPESWREEPFFELINFADNEGYIGPAAAARLLEDFRQHRETYLVMHGPKIRVTPLADLLPGESQEYDENEWFRNKYADWQTAMELASQGGMVVFH